MLLILTGGLAVFTQRLETPAQTEQRISAIRETERKILNAYTKSSSAAVPIDAGNKIVAVRRIHFFSENLKYNSKTAGNFIALVEIELLAALPPSIVMNCCNPVAFIGDSVRTEVFTFSSTRRIYIRLPEEEFNRLRGGEIVSVAVLPSSYDNLQRLKENAALKDSRGAPKTIRGVKFGRLAKRANARLPLIEEDRELFNQRIFGSRTN